MGYGDTKIQELGARLTAALKTKSKEYYDKAAKIPPSEGNGPRLMNITIALGLTEMANIIAEETKE